MNPNDDGIRDATQEDLDRFSALLRARRERRTLNFSFRHTQSEHDAMVALAELADCTITELLSFLVREAAIAQGVWPGPKIGDGKGGYVTVNYSHKRQHEASEAQIAANGTQGVNSVEIKPEDRKDFGLDE